jgi:hypothetical protein
MVVKTHRAHGLPVTALLLVTLLVVSAHAVHELTRARVLSPLPSQNKLVGSPDTGAGCKDLIAAQYSHHGSGDTPEGTLRWA